LGSKEIIVKTPRGGKNRKKLIERRNSHFSNQESGNAEGKFEEVTEEEARGDLREGQN
jgi:hypothetical protein